MRLKSFSRLKALSTRHLSYVTTFGMCYHLNQYSPLNQLNKSNVTRLVPI
jgi:glucose dehydrogenase